MMRTSMKMMMRRAVQARIFLSLITSQLIGFPNHVMGLKMILKVSMRDEGEKQKALKAVAILEGVESITLDMKDQKMTVIGDVDPVVMVRKLRKLCHTEILSVEEAKNNKKEKEPKKDKEEKEPEKEEPKKDEKKEAEMAELVKAYQAYNPYMTQHYFVKSAEEDPNACAIC